MNLRGFTNPLGFVRVVLVIPLENYTCGGVVPLVPTCRQVSQIPTD